MTRRVLANPVYPECFAFMITMLLAASDVEGKDGGEEQTRGTSRMVGRAYNSLCYNNQKQGTDCSKKKEIIVGSVIGAMFVLLGAAYLYSTCSERWKRRKASLTTEENVPLSDGSRTDSDCEKGVTKARNDKNKHDDNHMIPSSPDLDKSEEGSMSRTSSRTSDLPSCSHNRPPGLT